MNEYTRFLAFMLVAVFVGCNNDIDTPMGELDIPLDPSKQFIHFDANVSSRGALVEGNVLEDDFYVLGYQYRGDWNAEKVFATPNVFDATPQTVIYDDAL